MEEEYPVWNRSEIEIYKSDLNQMKKYTKCLNDLLYDFLRLRKLLKEFLIGYTPEEFVKRESSLTHLIFTNNTYPTIKPHSKNAYMFLCQYRLKKTPSFSAENNRRSEFCYGCHRSFDPITFISFKEELNDEDSIALICEIYRLNIPGYRLERSSTLTEKYRETLLSNEFKQLLTKGYQRTKRYRHTAQIKTQLDTYMKDFETIDRVSREETLDYIEPNSLPKRLSLELPTSKQTFLPIKELYIVFSMVCK